MDKNNLDILVIADDEKSHIKHEPPTSPPLDSQGYKELWDDVRANTHTTQETAEELTQTASNPEGATDGARKQRVQTHDQDPDFSTTTLKDLYTLVQEDSQITEEDVENLDRYLPSKIVNNTRDQAQDCIRRGDTEGACKVLEGALVKLEEQLKVQKHVDPTPWKISMAEILIDQGRRQEARAVLSNVPSHSRGEQSSYNKQHRNRRRTDADAEYEDMIDMAQAAETDLDRYRRAEDWDKAREVGQELYGIHPSYFDLDTPMDRFDQVRRILNAGVLKELEAKKATDPPARNRCLSQALEIYYHGCYASEIYHEFYDGNEATVSGFDHSDCANIFFSAARICYHFDIDGLLDDVGRAVNPQSFRCKGPNLTCQDWKHQALYFLEKGRARALLNSIIRGGVVNDIPRQLIKKTFTDMAAVADAARRVLRKRSSTTMLTSNCRDSSPSVGVPFLQLPMPGEPTSTLQGHNRVRSDSVAQPDTETSQEVDKQSLTIQTSCLPDSLAASIPASPSGAGIPELTPEEEGRIRARINWRKCLLWALAQANPALDATLGTAIPTKGGTADTLGDMRANIPADTLMVEYALASTSPCGIMVIVAAADAVKAVVWRETNTADIQRCIGDLRISMETSDYRTGSVRQTDTSSKPTVRPGGPVRQLSTVNQERFDALLWNLVVAPVMPHLKGKKKLIIVPSGDLAHVPWRVFFDVPITVVPSLIIWVRLQAQANAKSAQKPKVSIVSNAPEDREKKKNNEAGYLRNIPFSRIEALYIARLHEQSPFLADDKDRKDLQELAEGAQILHICAHSNFEPQAPMSSSLQLFREPLTITDWHKLSIKAELVVFSSCLSGISRAYDSGSTIGFAHTLLGTGTKAFIGSLWSVDDRATLLLMALFYEELRRPLPAVDALYAAQERMRTLTDDGLQDIVDGLEFFARRGGPTSQYVINPDHYFRELRETRACEWRDERYWAAFVLTGYGSSNIYPEGGACCEYV